MVLLFYIKAMTECQLWGGHFALMSIITHLKGGMASICWSHSLSAGEGDFQHRNIYGIINVQLQLAPEQRVDPQALVSIVLAAASWCNSHISRLKGTRVLKTLKSQWVTWINEWQIIWPNVIQTIVFRILNYFIEHVFKLCKERKILGLTCRECFKFATKA